MLCSVTRKPYAEGSVTFYIVQFFQEGGEFYFSDIYADRELEDSVRKDEVLWGKSDLLLYDDCVDCRSRLMLCSCICVGQLN